MGRIAALPGPPHSPRSSLHILFGIWAPRLAPRPTPAAVPAQGVAFDWWARKLFHSYLPLFPSSCCNPTMSVAVPSPSRFCCCSSSPPPHSASGRPCTLYLYCNRFGCDGVRARVHLARPQTCTTTTHSMPYAIYAVLTLLLLEVRTLRALCDVTSAPTTCGSALQHRLLSVKLKPPRSPSLIRLPLPADSRDRLIAWDCETASVWPEEESCNLFMPRIPIVALAPAEHTQETGHLCD